MAQPDWLLSWLPCSGPSRPPARKKQSASPVNAEQTKNKKTSESRRGECDSDKREGNNGVKAGKKWIPHPLYAVL